MQRNDRLWAVDDRTFVQKFGTRCFCGEPWSSEKRCGERGPEDYTIQQSLKMLFADRMDKLCAVCGTEYRGTPQTQYCGDACRKVAELRANRLNVAAYRERNAFDRACAWCGGIYRTAKPGQRFCSISCGNRHRHCREGTRSMRHVQ